MNVPLPGLWFIGFSFFDLTHHPQSHHIYNIDTWYGTGTELVVLLVPGLVLVPGTTKTQSCGNAAALSLSYVDTFHYNRSRSRQRRWKDTTTWLEQLEDLRRRILRA